MLRPHARVRVVTTVLIASALVLGTAGVASAHVQVESDSDVVGTDAVLTFRIPTESVSASTVKVVVTLPTRPPLLSVAAQSVPGWRASVTEAALPAPVVVDGTTLTRAPHEVTWTATAGGVPPEQFTELALLVENLPDAKQLTFPTRQYYSDGSVVTWDQPTPPGGPEPERPVPTLELTSAHTTPAAPVTEGSDPVARWLAALAVVIAATGLGLAVARRRTGAPHPPGVAP